MCVQFSIERLHIIDKNCKLKIYRIWATAEKLVLKNAAAIYPLTITGRRKSLCWRLLKTPSHQRLSFTSESSGTSGKGPYLLFTHWVLYVLHTSFLWLFFNVWKSLFSVVQTGVHLLLTEQLVWKKLLLFADMLLLEVCRDKQAEKSDFNVDIPLFK